MLSALLMVGCADDGSTVGTFGSLSYEDTYVTIGETGGDATVTLRTDADWKFDDIFSLSVTIDGQKQTKYFPLPVKLTDDKTDGELSWLTVDKLSGTAGETTLTFHADATTGGREAELRLSVGNHKQFIKVRQGSLEASPSTCKEVIDGPDGKTYQVTGTVTAIANTTYGNWYLNDGTGEIYIYGTLDKDGKTKNFSSLGIEVGDVVTVEGPKTTYGTTIELVDVTVVKIQKSLIKVITPDVEIGKEGGSFDVKVAYKGSGVNLSIPADAQSWLKLASSDFKAGVKTIYDTAAPADTTIFHFTVDANEGEGRQAAIEFSSSNASNSSAVTFTVKQKANVLPHGLNPDDPFTVAEAIAKCQEIGTTTDGQIYYAKGIISSIKEVSTSYGNATFNISDDGSDDNALTCYRSFSVDNAKFAAEDEIGIGDEVVVCGKLVNYNGKTPEFSGNVYIYKLMKASNAPGTKNHPFNIAQAIAFIDGGGTGEVYVEGIVSELVSGGFSANYGNGTFWISDDGTKYGDATKDFEAYRVYWLGNQKWVEGDDQIAVGDKVVLCGELTKYKTTYETNQNKAYVYSVNGKTSK